MVRDRVNFANSLCIDPSLLPFLGSSACPSNNSSVAGFKLVPKSGEEKELVKLPCNTVLWWNEKLSDAGIECRLKKLEAFITLHLNLV